MQYVRAFQDITIHDVPLVGGKNASLGEMIRSLSARGVPVPAGFAVTADGYRLFLDHNGLNRRIPEMVLAIPQGDLGVLSETAAAVRQLFLDAALPPGLESEILEMYRALSQAGTPIDVAVRSSATAEDLPQASFAGQQETYLNVRGERALLEACKRCFASLYTDRAISYRRDQGFGTAQVALSIGIQKMVRSDLACSGVMFSIDTESGFRDAVLINAAWGLGENVVQGAVNPDEFLVFKPTLTAGYEPIIHRALGTKEFKLVYDEGGARMVKNVPVAADDRARFCVDEADVLQLARWACIIEEHYSALRGEFTPMDIEWAKDGLTGQLYVVQARPETVVSHRRTTELVEYRIESRPPVLLKGTAVGEKVATGTVRRISNVSQLKDVRKGDVIVSDRTDPDWEPAMKRAVAIVTNRGGRTCHAAIVSRELGIPAVVGAPGATSLLPDGQVVTVSCAEGETGFVYQGKANFTVLTTPLTSLPRPRTRLMLNLADPAQALKLSFLPNDGVGLARLEFIIANKVKVHPMALIHPEQVTDPAAREALAGLTPQHFVDGLAEGVAQIAAAFYPKDVIVRMSDFKTNEYANLLGGRDFEPHEENPMLGFRGASRYYHPRYREGFALECRAMHKVRHGMGLSNVKLMIPFCRTVEEGRRVLAVMEAEGLRRGEEHLEIYVMCEVPSNVILADEFAHIFDGFSIGSNDLTQLLLGVDRDSELVAPLFDERNGAVTAMVGEVIRKARAAGRKIGICGQAPSDYPEFARFLVGAGIDSISVNPDVMVRTWQWIARVEAETLAATVASA